MRHPGVGIGLGGIGVGLATFVVQAAGVELPAGALVALGLVAVALIAAGIWLETAAGGRMPSGAAPTTVDGRGAASAILDEAAVSLHHTAYALDRVRLRLTQFGSGFFRDEAGTRTFAELREAGRSLDSLLERLKVRFRRDDELVLAFERADEATLAIYRAVELLKLEPPAEPGDAYAANQVRRLYDEKRVLIENQRAVFDESRTAFIERAGRASSGNDA